MNDPSAAIERLSSYGSTLDLPAFLEAHLPDWQPLLEVGMEVLYFNQEQMILEQIAQVGFSTSRGATHRTVSSADFDEKGLCSYAVATRESVLVPHVGFDRRYVSVQEPDQTQSELVVPLKLGDQVIGVLNLEAKAPRAFGNEHLEYFERISPLLAVMIEYRIRRTEEGFVEKTLAELSILEDREEILSSLLERTLGFLGEDFSGCILVPQPSGKALKVLDAKGLIHHPGDVLRRSKIPAVAASLKDPAGQYLGSPLEPAGASGLRSEFAIVLGSPRRREGVIYIGSIREAFPERIGRSIRRLSHDVTVLLQRIERRAATERERATRDILTLVKQELHNQASSLSLVATRLRQAKGVDSSLADIIADAGQSLRGIDTVVKNSLRPHESVHLAVAADTAVHFAKQFGIKLKLKGDYEAHTVCSIVGIKWMIANLLLNTAHHSRTNSQPEAELSLTTSKDAAILSYSDNGIIKGERSAALRTLREGREGRNGVKIIRRICDQFKWTFDADISREGNPTYSFQFRLVEVAASRP